MHRCIRLRVDFRSPRIECGPVRICLEPGGIRAEIHHLAARRHFAEIGRDPGWSGLLWSFVPLVLDFPALRFRLQFPSGLDQYTAPAARKKIFQPPAELTCALEFS